MPNSERQPHGHLIDDQPRLAPARSRRPCSSLSRSRAIARSFSWVGMARRRRPTCAVQSEEFSLTTNSTNCHEWGAASPENVVFRLMRVYSVNSWFKCSVPEHPGRTGSFVFQADRVVCKNLLPGNIQLERCARKNPGRQSHHTRQGQLQLRRTRKGGMRGMSAIWY